jgi:large subunit ribosomal protein L34e
VTRKLKTPGGKLVLQYTAKKAKGPQTPVGDQGRIHGVRVLAARLARRASAAARDNTRRC